MKEPVTRLDDCQYLLVSQMNYTLKNFADHCAQSQKHRRHLLVSPGAGVWAPRADAQRQGPRGDG